MMMMMMMMMTMMMMMMMTKDEVKVLIEAMGSELRPEEAVIGVEGRPSLFEDLFV